MGHYSIEGGCVGSPKLTVPGGIDNCRGGFAKRSGGPRRGTLRWKERRPSLEHLMTPLARSAIFMSLMVGLIVPTLSREAAIPQETIDRATERGVAALRKLQAADGSFSNGPYGSGPTSLAALAWLECGVSPADEQVRKAVEFIRKDCPAMNRTYTLALAIMLLDRVGDPLDEPIIHILTVQLLEGQKVVGGWWYANGDVSPQEVAKLRTLIERRSELKTVPNGPDSHSRPPVDNEIIDRLKRLEQRQYPTDADTMCDNSNTQFAVLGLWVGRRHGIPTDGALRRAEAYYRVTQDGGRWPYVPKTQVDERPANTCSGLLGLAIGAGIVREKRLRTHPEGKDGKPPATPRPAQGPAGAGRDELCRHAGRRGRRNRSQCRNRLESRSLFPLVRRAGRNDLQRAAHGRSGLVPRRCRGHGAERSFRTERGRVTPWPRCR